MASSRSADDEARRVRRRLGAERLGEVDVSVTFVVGDAEFTLRASAWCWNSDSVLATIVQDEVAMAADLDSTLRCESLKHENPKTFDRIVDVLRRRSLEIAMPVDDADLASLADLAKKLQIGSMAATLELEQLRRDWIKTVERLEAQLTKLDADAAKYEHAITRGGATTTLDLSLFDLQLQRFYYRLLLHIHGDSPLYAFKKVVARQASAGDLLVLGLTLDAVRSAVDRETAVHLILPFPDTITGNDLKAQLENRAQPSQPAWDVIIDAHLAFHRERAFLIQRMAIRDPP